MLLVQAARVALREAARAAEHHNIESNAQDMAGHDLVVCQTRERILSAILAMSSERDVQIMLDWINDWLISARKLGRAAIERGDSARYDEVADELVGPHLQRMSIDAALGAGTA